MRHRELLFHPNVGIAGIAQDEDLEAVLPSRLLQGLVDRPKSREDTLGIFVIDRHHQGRLRRRRARRRSARVPELRNGVTVPPRQQHDEADSGGPEGGADPEDQDRVQHQQRKLQRSQAVIEKRPSQEAHGAHGGDGHQEEIDRPLVEILRPAWRGRDRRGFDAVLGHPPSPRVDDAQEQTRDPLGQGAPEEPDRLGRHSHRGRRRDRVDAGRPDLLRHALSPYARPTLSPTRNRPAQNGGTCRREHIWLWLDPKLSGNPFVEQCRGLLDGGLRRVFCLWRGPMVLKAGSNPRGQPLDVQRIANAKRLQIGKHAGSQCGPPLCRSDGALRLGAEGPRRLCNGVHWPRTHWKLQVSLRTSLPR